MKIKYLVLMATLFGACVHQNSNLVNSPGWYNSHSDSYNSDYSTLEGSKKLQWLWQRKFEGTINLGPTTDVDGRVYVTTSAGECHLYVLDPQTGNTLWCTGEVNKFAVASSALLDKDNRIYIADDEAMSSFSDSGGLIWKMSIQGFPLSAQFTHTGQLLFMTHIGLVYVLERETGKPIINGENLSPEQPFPFNKFNPIACMKGTEECPCANMIAFDPSKGQLFFTYWGPGAKSAAVWAMQYTEKSGKGTLTKLWSNGALPGGSATSPVLSFDGTKVYVNDNSGWLYALDTGSGEIVWKYDLGYDPGGSQSISPEGYIMPSGGNGASLMCLKDEGDSVKLVWKNDLLHNRGVAMQANGGLAYATVASGAGRFYNDLLVLDVRTGEILDKIVLSDKTYFSVGTTMGPEGNVYVPSFNGHLYAFGPDTAQ